MAGLCARDRCARTAVWLLTTRISRTLRASLSGHAGTARPLGSVRGNAERDGPALAYVTPPPMVEIRRQTASTADSAPALARAAATQARRRRWARAAEKCPLPTRRYRGAFTSDRSRTAARVD